MNECMYVYNNCSQIIFTEHCDPFIPSILRDTFTKIVQEVHPMSTRSFSFDFENPLAQEAVLVNASLSRYENDWPSIPHTHAFTELFYVLEGSGEFVIEDETFTISKDDLIIVNPHIQHTETSRNAAPLSYFTVGVDGISFSFHDQKEFQIFNCRKKTTDLQFYFHSLFTELDQKNPGYEEICRHTLAILIMQLRRITVSGFQLVPSLHPSRECAQVKRYLDASYSQEITLDTLAKLTHLNKYYLSHEFTRYYGISPINYLNRRRIEVCKDLLENTDYDISTIAHLAGFSSQSYLAQSFRKHCQMTAVEYRKSVRK